MPNLVILHVGPQKTGTTAMQKAFADQSALLARNGIAYPQAGRDGEAHQVLARALHSGLPEVMDALRAEVAEARAVLISSELLSGIGPAALTRLRDAFPDAQFRVVYMLRRLVMHWPSHWRELVKHGQAFSFEDYMGRIGTRPVWPLRAPPLPAGQIAELAGVFGEASLTLPVYEARTEAGEDLAPAFVDEIFGLGAEAGAFRTIRKNLTPPDWETELVRLFNGLADGALDYAGKSRLRQNLLSHVRGDAPPWMPDFKAALASAPRYVLESSMPMIAEAQGAVLETFGASLVDPEETYIAPARAEVVTLRRDQIPADVMDALRALYDQLLPGCAAG